jgi:hypothetical protein
MRLVLQSDDPLEIAMRRLRLAKARRMKSLLCQ